MIVTYGIKSLCFFFNDTSTTEIYTLSLHDALPILPGARPSGSPLPWPPSARAPPLPGRAARASTARLAARPRSEEHTSELQSHVNLVCRLLLEKKKNVINNQLMVEKKGIHSFEKLL